MKQGKRITAFALAAALICTSSGKGYAAALAPSCDETLYITLDGDGEIETSSVVKRYEVREDGEIRDYGAYTQVANLTTKAEAVRGADGSYRFPVKASDGAFYFEGTTATTKQELPWEIQVRYLLNGVETPFEKLAGQKGLVEIEADLLPNKQVSDFYRNNMALMMTAVVDRDEVLSLRAEGAQIQTVGNMSTVVFLALPGEECHNRIAIGSDEFEFGGLVFLMVPLTLGQLDDVKDLKEAKDTLEDSKNAVSDSLDVLCDTLDALRGGISMTADGLRSLDSAREIIHSGRDGVYAEADRALADLDRLSESLRPFKEHTNQAQNALGAIRRDVNELASDTNKLETKICDLKDTVRYLRDDVEELRELLRSPEMDYVGEVFVQLLAKMQYDLEHAVQNQNSLNDVVEDLGEMLQRLRENGAVLDEETKLLKQLDFADTDYDLDEIEDLVLALQDEIPLTNDLATQETEKPKKATGSDWSIPSELKPALGGILESVNGITGDTGLLQDAAGMIALTRQLLAVLDSKKGSVDATLSETADLFDVIGKISKSAEDICGDIDDLNQTLEKYHPEMLATLADLGTMTDRIADGVSSLSSFFGTLEKELQTAGEPLNAGTQAALNGLADVLEHTNEGLGQTDVLRNAKNTIFDTIDDKWDEFSAEHTTILDMDFDTKTVSLTSAKNPAPRSMQIVVRTKEITLDDDEDGAVIDEAYQPEGTVLHRIGLILKKIWNAICSVFQ